MKRICSLLMAAVLLLTLSACGASNEDAATDSTTTTTAPTDGGESTSTTTAMGEDVDTTATEGETTTTESETTTSTENSADKDGSATTVTANKTTTTKKKTTATTTGKVTTTTKKTTTTTATQNNPAVVCTGYEIVKVERPNACYIDGKDVLTYFFGENEYFQEGDIVTFKLNFSKGSLADCIVEETHSAENIKISGNTITVKIVNDSIGNPHPLCISIANEQYDQFNTNRYVLWIEENNILWYDGKIVENNGAMTGVIENYALNKYNIQRCINMDAEEGYSYSRFTTGEDPSITKQHGVCNNGDDAFWKTDVENWVAYIKTIIDFYGDIGIKRIKICLEGDWVGFVASKNK